MELIYQIKPCLKQIQIFVYVVEISLDWVFPDILY